MRYYHYDRTKEKYSSLISQLQEKRDTFCGVGTRKIKTRLNKLAKNDIIAFLYRKALEIEDKNIQAKAYPDYRDKYYEEKSILIDELIKVCIDNNIPVGYSIEEIERKDRVDEYDERGRKIYELDPEYTICIEIIYIIYFDLPGCEQISWHTISKPNCDKYPREWDGKKNSTLPKLEEALLKQYPNIGVK